MATSKTRDKVKGKAEKAKGKARAAAGAATGNESERLKGDKDVVKGRPLYLVRETRNMGSAPVAGRAESDDLERSL